MYNSNQILEKRLTMIMPDPKKDKLTHTNSDTETNNSDHLIYVELQNISSSQETQVLLEKSQFINSIVSKVIPCFIYTFDVESGVYEFHGQDLQEIPSSQSLFEKIKSQSQLIEFVHEDDLIPLSVMRNKTLQGNIGDTSLPIIIRFKTTGETWFQLQISESLYTFEDGKVQLIGIVQDVTNNYILQSRLERGTFYDQLTSLPNRQLLIKTIKEKLQLFSISSIKTLAFFFIDMDRFKIVNDSLGYKVGDELLLAISKRIEKLMTRNTFLARIGGDEFGIIIENYESLDEIKSFAVSILREMDKPFLINTMSIYVTSSIGISVAGSGNLNAETLLGDADTAMYRAKRLGRGNYTFFNTQMHLTNFSLLQLENDIRTGILNNEFTLHYQPIYSLESNKIERCEALIRWNSPNRGMVLPNEFIPIAEETGLIIALDEWVIKQACKQANSWANKKIHSSKISVNVSSVHFSRDFFLDLIKTTLQETKLPTELLEIELTESTIMENLTHSRQLIQEIQQLGIQIAIDDFGTGYSSLAYLKELNINTLKIDASFIEDLMNDAHSQAIVRSIVSLGKSLGIKVVAEGVETLDQVKLLNQYNCDEIQGYLISKPLDTRKLSRFFKNTVFLPSSSFNLGL